MNDHNLVNDHLENQFDFKQLAPQHIVIVNDDVMGGESISTLEVAEQVVFSGRVSLANNGGFASVRLQWPPHLSLQLDDQQDLVLKVKGDGLKYQFRLYNHLGTDGAAYVYSFDTEAGQEQVFKLSADKFIPKFRGRTLSGEPELKWSEVVQMGVLIADQQAGNFALELIALEWP